MNKLMTVLSEKSREALTAYYTEREKFIRGYVGEERYRILEELAKVIAKLGDFTAEDYSAGVSEVRVLLDLRDRLSNSFYSSYGQYYWDAVRDIADRFDTLIREYHPDFLPTLVINDGDKETRINLL